MRKRGRKGAAKSSPVKRPVASKVQVSAGVGGRRKTAGPAAADTPQVGAAELKHAF